MRSRRGRRPSPNGGASRDGSGTGETIEKAQGSPERSAAAAAPQAPSSTNRTSGCSTSTACWRSSSWKRARSPNWPRPELSAPKRVRARQSSDSKRSISGLSACALEPEGTEPFDVVDPAPDRDAVAAIRQLEQRLDQRVQPARHRVDVREDDRHRSAFASGASLRRRAHARSLSGPAGRRHRWCHRATCLQLLIVLSRRPTSAGRGVTRSGRATRRRGPSRPCRPRHGESSKLVPKPGASDGPQWIECS